MSRAQQAAGLVIVLALAAGLGFAAWRMTGGSQDVCQACGRMVHADMRTVASIGGRSEVFCCPTCALSAGAQTHEAVHFERLADFATGHALQPAKAYAVEGSDVVPCVHSEQMLSRDGQPVPMQFDRCSPSIIAFASLAQAEQFVSVHGGRAHPFLEIVSRPAAHSAR